MNFKHKKSSMINISQDIYQDISTCVINQYIAETFTFPLVNLQCKQENFQQFIDALKEKYDVIYNKFDIETSNTFHYILDEKEKFCVLAKKGIGDIISLTIYSESINSAKEIYDIFKEHEYNPNDVNVEICTFSLDGGKLSDYSTILKIDDFSDDYDDFYPYIDINEMFKQFVNSDSNILIISGEPGTGKTRAANLFIKWMMQNPDYGINLSNNEICDIEDYSPLVSYVKNEDVLVNDIFWEAQLNTNPSLIFLDDADFCLTSRTAAVNTQEDILKNKFLSQLLSYSDGIHKIKTKIIVTTNVSVDNIDKAVLRKGRTFDVLRFRELTYDEAKSIWVNRGHIEENFSKHFPYKSESVKPCDIGSAMNIEKYNGIDQYKEYLLESDISILNKKNKSSVGFI